MTLWSNRQFFGDWRRNWCCGICEWLVLIDDGEGLLAGSLSLVNGDVILFSYFFLMYHCVSSFYIAVGQRFQTKKFFSKAPQLCLLFTTSMFSFAMLVQRILSFCLDPPKIFYLMNGSIQQVSKMFYGYPCLFDVTKTLFLRSIFKVPLIRFCQ